MYAQFDRFEIKMTKAEAASISHPGPCDDDVAMFVKKPHIVKQLDNIPPGHIRAELKEYGAWDGDELNDEEANRRRIVWIAAGDILQRRPGV